nr:alpha-glucan family phosphorylase [Streptomyces sp. HNM0574]
MPEPLRPLSELARNLRWSWHPGTRALFRAVDPSGWEAAGGDPLRLLGALAPDRPAELAADDGFLRRLTEVHEDLRRYLREPRWYQHRDGDEGGGGEPPSAVAYFSPEFGITEALPQYSGGLGILAGDHLKAASDLGVPLIGVGLLYRHGYFRQTLSRDGWQQEHYPVLDPGELPLELLREGDGAPVHTELRLPGGRLLRAHVWQARVGRVPLLLLDSDVEGNTPGDRDVTDRLYGGGSEHRLLQEMLLGIGGVRALRAYCRITGHPEPEVFHTNEGHAGFLGLERIRELTGGEHPRLSFAEALETVRAGNVFTTHTPVSAGIDRFERELVARHFGEGGELDGIDLAEVLELGAETHTGADPEVFNMAAMGLRLAQRANGVSALHGTVSREMFAGLWPGFDAAEVPIASVTNGVHGGTWAAPEVPPAAHTLDDAALWELRRTLRSGLVDEVRERLRASCLHRGASRAETGWTGQVLDPEVLTIGFARRVPSYKRLTLMLRDPERLRRLLLDPERPVQIVVAGKAHPADEGGKRLIQDLVRFADDPRVRHRVVFLPDYGMGLAQRLCSGADVWLNNPLRPLEACGTSGMKAALNGGLNLSVLDGWWDEWYEPSFGWAVPTADGEEAQHEDRRDDVEAAALYDLVEQQVAPRFYDDRDAAGVPRCWTAMVRQTLARLGPKVQAERMVREYTEVLYAPAARARRALDPDAARELAAWKARVRREWPLVSVGHVETAGPEPEAGPGREAAEWAAGAPPVLRARVTLGGLTPDDVEVQAVVGRVDDSDRLDAEDSVRLPLKPAGSPSLDGGRWYEGTLELGRTGSFGCTVRVLPSHRLLASPAELGLVAAPADEPPESAAAD